MKRFLAGVAAMAISLGAGSAVVTAQSQQYPPQNAPQYPQEYPPPPARYPQGQYPQNGPYPQGQAGPPPPFPQQGQPYPGQSYPEQYPQGDSSQAQDQNAPGVARLSFMTGDVSTQRGDNGDWVAATLNTPVSVNDRVATANNGRAELQLDASDVLRMSATATAKIANLNRTNIQVQVGQGLVTYAALRGSEANSEIDTPNASIHPNGPGEYRILVNSDAETQMIVRQGSAEVSTPQGSTHVDAGQLITVAGTDTPQYKTENAPGRDEWDSWNMDRDKRIQNASSWRNTDRYYTGTEDLDQNGTWTDVPDYGQVWVPQQGPDWAPYRDGRWVWEPYYGWTWVSYEPWGWAPYHYGRWFVYNDAWAWWPGPVYGYPGYYPIWAPAYVSFFGFGGGGWGFGIGFGFGGYGRFGWLPCGPGDWYHPWYGRWGGRENFVGVRDGGNFHEGFGPLGGNRARQFSNLNLAGTNDRVRGGISSMGANEFGRGAVSAHQENISAASFRSASLVGGRMPVGPSEGSYSPSGRNANPSTVRNAPPNSQRFFSGASRTNAGTSNSARNGASFDGNRNPSASAGANSTRGNANAQSGRAWNTFSPPQSANTGRPGQSFEQNNRGGEVTSNSPRGSAQANGGNSWQHFTPPSQSQQAQQYNRGGSYQSQQAYQRGGSSPSYARQPLNMRQPVVTPRSYNAPSYNAPRGNYTTARPSFSAPSAPRGGGGSYSAPRGGGGGGSHGGGGGGASHGGGNHR